MTEWVFGYASLVDDAAGAGRATALRGYRRVWGVATDNLESIPGYKTHLLRSDGSRPPVFVAWIDIVRDPDSSVNGVLRAVGPDELAALDARERNYDRVDVGAEIDGPETTVWTYRGSVAGRERLRRARAAGSAVVSRDYLVKVNAGFRALGGQALHDFEASTAQVDLPVWDLERVDLDEDAQPVAGSGR